MMTINQAPMNRPLVVRSFRSTDEREYNEIESRLMHLGFLDGQTVIVVKKAPLFQEPLLVEVRGRMIALSKDEAAMVEVEVME